MPDPSLARRYATALFGVAVHRDVVDRIESDLNAVSSLLSEDRSFRGFMHSPQVLDEHKTEMMGRALGERVHTLLLQFMQLLLDKKRFPLFEQVARAYRLLADERRGVVRARVTTPGELDSEELLRLRERLASLTGRQVEVEWRSDPEMLGGVSVVLGDQLLDGSVRRALTRLREELGAVSVI